jgi:ribosomal protein S6--L-glutamate ligase
VVVKPLFGAEGRGIVRVTDPDMGWRVFSTLERLQAVIYLQKFVEHPGFDTRVLVLDGEVIGGMKRFSPDDFRTNVARSGRGECHRPTAIEAELAIRGAQATGVRFAGIDILQGRDGEALVLEVNAVPGWRAFASVTGIDVATRFLDHLSRHPIGG